MPPRPRGRPWRLAAALILLLLGAALLAGGPSAQDNPPTVTELRVDGPIGPATASYVKAELRRAAERGRRLVILRMDTPGGLSAAMRDIVSAILASPVPVATYVAPRGARAASAGTYILYASHVAAMAPGTTLGAATPVQMGGGGGGGAPMPGGDGPADTPGGGGDSADNPDAADGDAADEGPPPQPQSAKKLKAINDAVAYIKALAELRGRNADWAEQAVREAATLTVDAAVARDVVDVKAADRAALLRAIDGRAVALGEGTRTLATADAAVEERPPDWRDKLLAAITNPNIAFIFMTLGIYGLIFELSNPGALVPGVLGTISLLIGFYALNVLPVNYAGLALMAIGCAFMVAEAFVPSFGVLGLGGLGAFGLGATILFDTGSPAFALSWWTIVGVTGTTGAVLILLVGYLVRAQRGKVHTGQEEMIGLRGRVESWHGAGGHGEGGRGEGRRGGGGRVFVHGERWNAVGPADLAPGQAITVTAMDGLTLTVAPADRPSGPAGAQAGETP